jgi:hypothetical protein
VLRGVAAGVIRDAEGAEAAHLLEATRQIAGRSGSRQVANAQIAFGYNWFEPRYIS